MIESTVTTTEEKEITYPCLMKSIHNGIIVLFTDKNTGMQVSGQGAYHMGYHSQGWLSRSFIPFTGTVTLKNA